MSKTHHAAPSSTQLLPARLQFVTDRRQDERNLIDDRRRLLAALSIAQVGAWEMGVPDGVITWSDTLFELYGLDPAAFAGNIDAALRRIHTDDIDGLRAALDLCATTGIPMWHRHQVYRANDGELRWFEAQAARSQTDCCAASLDRWLM